MEKLGINMVAILVATVANFIVGFLWYSPLFGKAWAKEMGYDMSVKPPAGAMAKGMIFMVIGIVGYFTVPSIANYIVHASGANALLYKTTNLFSGGAQSTVSTTVSGATSMLGGSPTTEGSKLSSMTAPGNLNSEHYMNNKLSGK